MIIEPLYFLCKLLCQDHTEQFMVDAIDVRNLISASAYVAVIQKRNTAGETQPVGRAHVS